MHHMVVWRILLQLGSHRLLHSSGRRVAGGGSHMLRRLWRAARLLQTWAAPAVASRGNWAQALG